MIDKLRALNYFVATAESKSFTAASARFSVPASSISRRIADLEAELGAQLLTRSTRSVVVTEIGKQYLEHAKAIISHLGQADQMVKNYQKSPRGVLKISALSGFGERILLPILDRFVQQYENITLDITLSDQLSKLEQDEVDIAIRGGFAPEERVVAVRLMDNDFIAAASPSYLAKHGTPKHPSELSQHDGLFFNTPIGATPWLYLQQDVIHTMTGRQRLRVNHGQWLIDKTLDGTGIVMLPRWELHPYLQTGQLHELKFAEPINVSFGRDLGIFLLYQKLDYSVPKVRAAVDFIREHIGKQYNKSGEAI